MPDLPKTDVIAIVCSDLHLCENAPAARAAEPNWWDAMARPLNEIGKLSRHYDCPILIAGDLFDRWNPRPPLINFALATMPRRVYAIPGNHDLPYHDPGMLGQSAYWTLVAAGRINNLEPGVIHNLNSDLTVYGFPFGTNTAARWGKRRGVSVALVHAFVWRGIAGDAAACYVPPNSTVNDFKLRGYDVAAFGDNHQHFTASHKYGAAVINCGAAIRRTTAERDYTPAVGLITKSGEIIPRPLESAAADKWIDTDEPARPDVADESAAGAERFAAELRNLQTDSLDFVAAVRLRLAFGVPKSVRRKIWEVVKNEH